MSVTITVKDNSPELLQKVMVAVGRFVRKAAFFIEGQIKTSMAAAKHGHQYGAHVASAPGESPAIDSSNLSDRSTRYFRRRSRQRSGRQSPMLHFSSPERREWQLVRCGKKR